MYRRIPFGVRLCFFARKQLTVSVMLTFLWVLRYNLLLLPDGYLPRSKAHRSRGFQDINPDMTLEDQYVLAEGKFISREETEDGGLTTLDMTDAYRMNGAITVSYTHLTLPTMAVV